MPILPPLRRRVYPLAMEHGTVRLAESIGPNLINRCQDTGSVRRNSENKLAGRTESW